MIIFLLKISWLYEKAYFRKMGISKAYFKGKGYEFLEKGFWCERVPPLILCCALYVSLLLLVFKKKKILSAIAGFSKNKLKFSFYTLESYFMCFNNLLILFDNSPQHPFLIFHITPNTIHFLTLSFSLVLFLFVSLSLFLLSNQQLQHTITDAHFPTNLPPIA